jgi:biopolymer transport protein ExbB
MLNTLIDFFQSGGPFMYPIIVVLAAGLTITLERWLYLTSSKQKNRRMLAKLMEEGIMEAIPRLEKRTHYLAMFANIATLLGLLGTIIGLIKAFTAVAQVDPSLKAEILSTSISVAMNTTAFGLIVAIPLLIFYTLLQTKTVEIIDSLEMATKRFTKHLARFKKVSG